MWEGDWHLVTNKGELTEALVRRIAPRYIFFPHWSWIVPSGILAAAECVCFHMTDVPYGRGGSPLQNLLVRGHSETVISALRMTDVLDGGPVYRKTPLDLRGSAQQIFERAAMAIAEMIEQIALDEPTPVAQSGTIVDFERRQPWQSELPHDGSLARCYDHIRMLDAESYPRAFIDHGGFRLEFSDSQYSNGELTARVTIRDNNGNDQDAKDAN